MNYYYELFLLFTTIYDYLLLLIILYMYIYIHTFRYTHYKPQLT